MFHVKHSLDITGFQLKIAAIVAMTCNHVANVFGAALPAQLNFALYAVGGMTFPIMAFLLVEGYVHTSDLRKYALRLLAFALVAQVPYQLVFGLKGNVLFTLAIGLGILWLNGRFSTGVGLLATILATALLNPFLDWGTTGLVIIYMFGTLRGAHDLRLKHDKNLSSGNTNPGGAAKDASAASAYSMNTSSSGTISAANAGSTGPGDAAKNASVENTSNATNATNTTDIIATVGTMIIPMCVTCINGIRFANPFALGYALIGYTMATILLCLYRGRRGKSMKWFFYAYYPLHLFVIWVITVILQ